MADFVAEALDGSRTIASALAAGVTATELMQGMADRYRALLTGSDGRTAVFTDSKSSAITGNSAALTVFSDKANRISADLIHRQVNLGAADPIYDVHRTVLVVPEGTKQIVAADGVYVRVDAQNCRLPIGRTTLGVINADNSTLWLSNVIISDSIESVESNAAGRVAIVEEIDQNATSKASEFLGFLCGGESIVQPKTLRVATVVPPDGYPGHGDKARFTEVIWTADASVGHHTFDIGAQDLPGKAVPSQTFRWRAYDHGGKQIEATVNLDGEGGFNTRAPAFVRDYIDGKLMVSTSARGLEIVDGALYFYPVSEPASPEFGVALWFSNADFKLRAKFSNGVMRELASPW